MSLTIGQNCRGSASTKGKQVGEGQVGGGEGCTWTGRRDGVREREGESERERGEDKQSSFSPPFPFLFFLQAVVEKDSEQEGATGSEGHVSLITQHGRGKHCH